MANWLSDSFTRSLGGVERCVKQLFDSRLFGFEALFQEYHRGVLQSRCNPGHLRQLKPADQLRLYSNAQIFQGVAASRARERVVKRTGRSAKTHYLYFK